MFLYVLATLVVLVLSVRFLWLLATGLMLQAWLWRDCLDQEWRAHAYTALTDQRRTLFWAFLRERFLVALSPLLLLVRPFSLRERGTMIGLLMLQVLTTIGLLLPACVLGLPAPWVLLVRRRVCLPLQQQFEAVAFSEAALKRQTLSTMDWGQEQTFAPPVEVQEKTLLLTTEQEKATH